jgi:hypothetical protein
MYFIDYSTLLHLLQLECPGGGGIRRLIAIVDKKNIEKLSTVIFFCHKTPGSGTGSAYQSALI